MSMSTVETPFWVSDSFIQLIDGACSTWIKHRLLQLEITCQQLSQHSSFKKNKSIWLIGY